MPKEDIPALKHTLILENSLAKTLQNNKNKYYDFTYFCTYNGEFDFNRSNVI